MMISIVRKNLFSSLFSNPNFSFLCNSSSHLRRRLITTHSPQIYDVLFRKHQFSPEFASSIASAHLTKSTTPKRADSVLSFLKDNSFTNSQLEKIVRYDAGILGFDVESLQLKLSVFRDLGLSSEEVAKMMVQNKAILYSNVPNRIVPSLSILKGLLGSNDGVARLVRKCERLLTSDLDKTLMPNVEMLKSSGMPMERVRLFLHTNPRCLLIKPDIMKKSVDRAIEFRVPKASTAFIHAVSFFAHTTQETWEAKLQILRDSGFSDDEILTMFRRQPNVFSQCQNKLKSAVELLVGTGKYSPSDIVSNPSSIGSSNEKRLELRLQILGLLASRNLIEKWPSLPVLNKYTDSRFFNRFVKPYVDEIGEESITKILCRGQDGKKL